jgi:hypothetical protein
VIVGPENNIGNVVAIAGLMCVADTYFFVQVKNGIMALTQG